MLSENSVLLGPTALATLGEIVAIKQLLGGDFFNFFTVFDLQSSLNRLYERKNIAASANSLISDLSSEVEASHIPPIK